MLSQILDGLQGGSKQATVTVINKISLKPVHGAATFIKKLYY